MNLFDVISEAYTGAMHTVLFQKAKTLDPLRGLKMWKKPELEWKNFAASDFVDLLPDEILSTTVGYTYALIGNVQK